MARYRIYLPPDPLESDTLRLTVKFLDISVDLLWPHSQQHELINLINQFAGPILRKSSLEFLTHQGAAQVDGDLDNLFEDEA